MQSEQFRSGCVAILGQPNVGKSTLLNKIIGEPLAIVTSKPQTTRNRITGILNRPNAQIVFVDTPGYHSLPRLLNQFMLGEIEKTIEESDLFCFLVDPTSDTPELDDEVIDRLIGKKTLVIINKADKIPKEKWKETSVKYSCHGRQGDANLA